MIGTARLEQMSRLEGGRGCWGEGGGGAAGVYGRAIKTRLHILREERHGGGVGLGEVSEANIST